MKNVVVNGACGKMGREVVNYVLGKEDVQLVGAFDQENVGKDIVKLIGKKEQKVIINDDLSRIIKNKSVDVIIDFTAPGVVMENIRTGLKSGIDMIIGTTGITEVDFKEIEELAQDNQANILVAPNFAIGAVLMMKFARKAAKYMDCVEIIEMHHDQKIDAPSGTAIKTAEAISDNWENKIKEKDYLEQIEGVRGGNKDGISIHSVRLPGLVAHQQVIFGSKGQTLTLKHDSHDRKSFMKGIGLALNRIKDINGFVYGLHHLLD